MIAPQRIRQTTSELNLLIATQTEIQHRRGEQYRNQRMQAQLWPIIYLKLLLRRKQID